MKHHMFSVSWHDIKQDTSGEVLKSLPPALYKYRSWEFEAHKRMLTENEIYFSSNLELNDPFDRGISWRYDLETPEDLAAQVDKHIERYQSHLPIIEQEKLRNIALKERRFNDAEFRRSASEKLYAKHGIFSLSGLKDDLLLWSHYSDSNKGFCVCFDTIALINHWETLFYHDKSLISLYRVNYIKEYPKLIPSMYEDHEDRMAIPLTTKSIDWEYEDEYRLIFVEGADRREKISDGIIREVVLGSEIEIGHEREIIDALRQKEHKPRLMKAKRVHDDYALEFDEIEY